MSNLSELLHFALRNGDVSRAEALLREGASPNLPDNEGTTPLHIICQFYDDGDYLARKLFELSDFKYQPIRINSQDKTGHTPLHIALYKGSKKLAALLLKSHADTTLAAVDGTTPLHVLAKICPESEEHAYEVERLIQTLIENNPIERIKFSARVGMRDYLGNTPLHYALENLHLQLFNWLLELGADFNAANNEGTTPLHVMCDRMMDDDSHDYLDKLFEIARESQRRVLIDARDCVGRTPLDLAVANLLPNTVSTLLDQGADLSVFDFPERSCFALRIDPKDKFFFDKKVELAARALIIVELIEEEVYELNSSEAMTVMSFFAKHKLFEEPLLEKYWYNDQEFEEHAKKIMMIEKASSPSLHELILMTPKEAKKALTYEDYYNWAQEPYSISGYDQICALHLCEKMSRGLFLKWALLQFRHLIHCRLPEEVCTMILPWLSNKDLYKICLVAASLKPYNGNQHN